MSYSPNENFQELLIAENLLAPDFTPAAPDRLWSSEIT